MSDSGQVVSRASVSTTEADREPALATIPESESDSDNDPPPGVRQFACAWGKAIAGQLYPSLSRAELDAFLLGQAAALVRAAGTEPVDTARARAVGTAMVRADLLGVEVLTCTVETVGRLLAGAAGVDPCRVPVVQGALVTGYMAAHSERVLAEQETVRQAEVEARLAVESALRSSESLFRAVFANAGVGIGLSDMSGRIVDGNQAFASMLGYTVPEFCRLSVANLLYPDDVAGMVERRRQLVSGEHDYLQMEKRYLHRDGTVVWVHLTVSLIRGEAGEPLYTVSMVEDISASREMQDRLRHQATHDTLTQLPNRATFQERLVAALARPVQRVGLCYLDLDGFKMVNDRLGHDIGDALLVQVAARLHQCMTDPRCLVARMGGDEFVVLVEDPHAGEMAELADAILAELQTPFTVGGHELPISCSIGVVEREPGGITPAELLKAADVTMYWAKSDGRGRWAMFDKERHARDMTRYTLSATLLPGVRRGEFILEYQPLIRLADGGLRGVEALVRWQHPTLGRLGPDHFIELAEETGSIVQLGRRVLEQACAQASDWNTAHPGANVVMSVNLAVRQAHEPGIVADIASILADSGLRPELLQVEVTESALLGPAGQPLDALHRLRDLGVRIAVDDFGTGYSNLAYLRHLPLHDLKLAGSLIDGLRAPNGPPTADEAIVTALISLAHRLGVTVTAEGVETPEQATRLLAMDCDTAQGWHFGRPAAPAHIEALLARPLAATS
jgi:diguanylate cyclase (GGDEF)-like protein/PAS domain S-box-containing protein